MKALKNLHDRLMSWIFHSLGWQIQGSMPELKKYIIVAAPHTSNWDFCVGYCVRAHLKFRANFLAKRELFKIPLVGWFLRVAGGYPVDRSKKTNLVDQIADLYKKLDEFSMAVTPEGTRSAVKEWKTGFYRIAKKANVPVVKIGLDYGTKQVFIDKAFYLTDNMEKDMEDIKNFFRQYKGKYPEHGVL